MRVSILKISRKKEVINRLALEELAGMICKNPEEQNVYDLRMQYHFCTPVRQNDGQIMVDSKHFVGLPRVCFAVEFDKYREKARLLAYNGLVVIEANGLKTYEDAVNVRNQAARMDETVMAFMTKTLFQ